MIKYEDKNIDNYFSFINKSLTFCEESESPQYEDYVSD